MAEYTRDDVATERAYAARGKQDGIAEMSAYAQASVALDRALSEMSEALAHLGDKISPILRDAEPEDVMTRPELAESHSVVVSVINESAAQLNRMIRTVNNLRDRVEF